MYHLVSGGQQQNKLPHSVSQHPMKKIFSKQPPGADMVQNASEGGERKKQNKKQTKDAALILTFAGTRRGADIYLFWVSSLLRGAAN